MLLQQLWLLLLQWMVANVVVADVLAVAYLDALMHMQLLYLVALTDIVTTPL